MLYGQKGVKGIGQLGIGQLGKGYGLGTGKLWDQFLGRDKFGFGRELVDVSAGDTTIVVND